LEQRLEAGPGKEAGSRGRRYQLGPQQLRTGRAGHIAAVILDRGRELGSIHHNPSRPGGQHTDQHPRLWSSLKRPSAPTSSCGTSPSTELAPQAALEGPSVEVKW
jgi:hypothetical protein